MSAELDLELVAALARSRADDAPNANVPSIGELDRRVRRRQRGWAAILSISSLAVGVFAASMWHAPPHPQHPPAREALSARDRAVAASLSDAVGALTELGTMTLQDVPGEELVAMLDPYANAPSVDATFLEGLSADGVF